MGPKLKESGLRKLDYYCYWAASTFQAQPTRKHKHTNHQGRRSQMLCVCEHPSDGCWVWSCCCIISWVCKSAPVWGKEIRLINIAMSAFVLASPSCLPAKWAWGGFTHETDYRRDIWTSCEMVCEWNWQTALLLNRKRHCGLSTADVRGLLARQPERRLKLIKGTPYITGCQTLIIFFF